MEPKGGDMSNGVKIINQPRDYWDIFSSDLFNGTSTRTPNWLEIHESRLSKKQQLEKITNQNPEEPHND